MQKGFVEPGEKPQRFYKSVEVAEADGGFAVKLDGRNVRTPKGRPLVLPTRALAELVAAEWAAQGEHIELADMHANRLANTALESIPAAREATAAQVAEFAGSDLLCYSADQPAALVQRQGEQWEPVLQRVERELGLAFVRASGIVHQAQPEATLAQVKAAALELDDFALAGLAFGTALFGSAILSVAVQRGWITGPDAYELSRLDEAFQEEKWGVDEEAAERTARLRGEAAVLERWFRALEAA
ncbi:ATP12 family chaperone protein [Phenylobacterium sp. J367]|uniref:ATP12 family chaperone protein n=1 Tax=Phenylobacterium sp. J367 TaxID=2898435 RepID=UPI0021512214|nr:ATP12 family protein [Phenylobacterium sp. J367]MCR5880735.1 ATPase [Phenylobacterium sp. J367]